jgi:hypothetical protein
VRLQTQSNGDAYEYLVVGGEDHKTGHADDYEQRFARLEGSFPGGSLSRTFQSRSFCKAGTPVFGTCVRSRLRCLHRCGAARKGSAPHPASRSC